LNTIHKTQVVILISKYNTENPSVIIIRDTTHAQVIRLKTHKIALENVENEQYGFIIYRIHLKLELDRE